MNGAPRGSPPRGRGKVSLAKVVCFDVKDHPRVGGEKKGVHFYKDDYQGSPPRGRGKVLEALREQGATRITPAWAGKSYWECPDPMLGGDHPRVGGEKTKKIP